MRARPRSTRSLSTLPAPCAPTPIPTSARLSPTREAHIPVLASGQAAPVTVPMSLEPPDTCHHFSLAFCRHGRGELQLDAAGGVRGGAHLLRRPQAALWRVPALLHVCHNRGIPPRAFSCLLVYLAGNTHRETRTRNQWHNTTQPPEHAAQAKGTLPRRRVLGESPGLCRI